jgi:hypothetical protein
MLCKRLGQRETDIADTHDADLLISHFLVKVFARKKVCPQPEDIRRILQPFLQPQDPASHTVLLESVQQRSSLFATPLELKMRIPGFFSQLLILS